MRRRADERRSPRPLALVGAFAAALAAGVAAAAPAQEPPNFLVVLADDLGIEHAGAWGVGASPAAMPNVDSLAEGGLRFDQAWSSPVCSPTRAGLLTGRYSLRHGVIGAVQEPEDVGLPLAETTIAESLGAAGYATALFGKWHLGVDPEEGGLDAPLDQGFDRAVVTEANLPPADEDYFAWTWLRDGAAEPGSGYITSATVDEALGWIGEVTEPWLAVVAFHAPHGPEHCPPPELVGEPCAEGDSTLAKYRAMTEAMDRELGRLLDAVDPARTVVAFASDNGSAPAVALPPVEADRAKRTTFEGGVRVPFALWGAGVPVATTAEPVAVQDLLPTFVELAGAEAPPGLDGVSLAPLLADPAAALERDCVYTEILDPSAPPARQWMRGIRNGCYKLVARGSVVGMADVCSDPWEQENLLDAPLDPEARAAVDTMMLCVQDLRG